LLVVDDKTKSDGRLLLCNAFVAGDKSHQNQLIAKSKYLAFWR